MWTQGIHYEIGIDENRDVSYCIAHENENLADDYNGMSIPANVLALMPRA